MWTNAETVDLTVEEREVLARWKLSLEREQHLKDHEQLLKEARGRGGWRSGFEPLPIIALFGIGLLFIHDQDAKYLYAFIGLLYLLQFQWNSTNRRLDALLELRDLDRNSRDNSHNSITEKAG